MIGLIVVAGAILRVLNESMKEQIRLVEEIKALDIAFSK